MLKAIARIVRTPDLLRKIAFTLGLIAVYRMGAFVPGPGVDYPAVLFTVFDSDSRVDPCHARKMCAALQHATASALPVLLRRETQVGHGARSVSRTVELLLDEIAFLGAHTGLTTGPGAEPGAGPGAQPAAEPGAGVHSGRS